MTIFICSLYAVSIDMKECKAYGVATIEKLSPNYETVDYTKQKLYPIEKFVNHLYEVIFCELVVVIIM